ncbi:C-type lectin domain-containing protein [Caenorhabditis elegans]|uniref:C-type lectin domain-containing protein n=1 Tax=Caenorhabditis elegans TaxID=6239 RepID=O16210_CAEEL|nr:C-type lectin domain-containing protein [Caenorhabditis elegans]CCD69022.2 C-type lectin domain-containing protein [Caenorhabditis elegans]|eukprot:NP_001335512.1 Uncharacterized protein CELE_F29A7.8 [Caenorhabditis elegans]
MSDCLANPECAVVTWRVPLYCGVFKLVVPNTDSLGIMKITKTGEEDGTVVGIKAQLVSGQCPSLQNKIIASLAPPQSFQNQLFSYTWSSDINGWSVTECSTSIIVRSSSVTLCVKITGSDVLASTGGGVTQPDAQQSVENKGRQIIGLASMEELEFISQAGVFLESYWIGGKASNCLFGICSTITWTDSWISSSTYTSIPSSVPDPCLAVVNGEVVGRDCNEKLRGALCAWQIL